MSLKRSMLTRRTLLAGLPLLLLGASAPFALQAAASSWRAYRSPFSLGIASGSPSPEGFVLWTRLLGDEVPQDQALLVDWQVFVWDDPQQVVAAGQAWAVPELAHSVHVEVSGLPADRWYGYRFQAGGQQSPPGRTRTMPEAGAVPARLRFAYASCHSWELGYYAAYRQMQQEDLDLVLFVGDYIYEYAGSQKLGAHNVRFHHLPKARTLADFRNHYALYKSEPLLQAMHAHCPWLVVWDDHEVENDYAGIHSIYATEGFFQLRAAAYQAYYEHMPLPLATLQQGIAGMQRGAEMRIYDRVAFGRLALFHLLDCRQYRDAPLCPDRVEPNRQANCQPAHPSRSMLGVGQEEWLEEGLRVSAELPCLWNVIVSQSRFTPGNYAEGLAVMASRDRWDGFPEARQRLLQALLRHRPRNPVIIGGDIHYHWVARVHQDPYDVRSPVLASEFIGTSITSRSGRNQEATDRHAAQNPHCLLSYSEKRGYGVVEITPKKSEIILRVVENVRDEHSPVTTLARFEVMDGQPVRACQNNS
ncbi:MAG: alkaline phosphatase D family protein [Magnetococcales bacterium]|nr:alkaline phosphatase D family protein [Magnetococcales bacterium]